MQGTIAQSRFPVFDLIKKTSLNPPHGSTAPRNLAFLGCKAGSQVPSDPSFDIAGGGDELFQAKQPGVH